MESGLIFFLLFILPFVILPFGVSQFENPKVLIAETGVLTLLFISLLNGRLQNFGKNKHFYLYIVIFLLTIIDLLFLRTEISFFGNAFRLQGIFLLWILLLFSYLSSHISLKNIPWWIFSILIASELIVTLFLPVDPNNRFVGTLGEPNASSSYLLFLWPFAWFNLSKNDDFNRKLLKFLLFTLVSLVILFLFKSRSALIGLGLQALFLFLIKLNFSIKNSLLICLFLLIISFTLPFIDRGVSFENRAEIWISAFNAGLKNPVLGGGFGNAELLLNKEAKVHNFPIQYSYVDSSHNIFLDWWVQGGIIGLTIFSLIVYLAGKSFVAIGSTLKILLFIGLLTTISFNPGSVIGFLQFWWIIGQGLKD